MSVRPRVLIVDDEQFVRDSLAEILTAEGCAVAMAGGVDDAFARLVADPFDVVLTDLKMPARDGLSLLEQVRAHDPTLPVILITGVGTVSQAVRAMKGGAFDFVQKPVDPEELALLVRRAAEHRALRDEVGRLRSAMRDLRGRRAMVGSSPAMERVRAQIAQVAATDAPVLVTGESGTGKELVAHAIHIAGRRAEAALLEVNCAAVPSELFESELFGHRRGSFTSAVADRKGRFAEAEGGTLVLDEVGALAATSQAKLLRVLETGQYQVVGESRSRRADVRVIAITNDDLGAAVKTGRYRADLYYRLNVFPIDVPPLRERRADLPELALHLLERPRWTAEASASAPLRALPPDALEVLGSYDWPGNVRELRNVLERAAIAAGGAPIDAALLRRILESGISANEAIGPGDLRLRDQLDGRERELIVRALARSGGKKKEAAQALGIDPRNLAYYLRKHGLADGGASAADAAG